jgi:hypothetical protein
METTTFTALCERAGRWWTIRIPQVEGLSAQVRGLDQAEVVARQVISRTLNIPVEAIRVDVLPDAPAPIADALRARHTARMAVDAANRATRTALELLAREGFAFHDAATMLGLSPAEIEVYGPAGPVPAPGPGSAAVPGSGAVSGPLPRAAAGPGASSGGAPGHPAPPSPDPLQMA